LCASIAETAVELEFSRAFPNIMGLFAQSRHIGARVALSAAAHGEDLDCVSNPPVRHDIVADDDGSGAGNDSRAYRSTRPGRCRVRRSRFQRERE
jgi:hypothetical protein